MKTEGGEMSSVLRTTATQHEDHETLAAEAAATRVGQLAGDEISVIAFMPRRSLFVQKHGTTIS